jgi:hypothetical protein
MEIVKYKDKSYILAKIPNYNYRFLLQCYTLCDLYKNNNKHCIPLSLRACHGPLLFKEFSLLDMISFFEEKNENRE